MDRFETGWLLDFYGPLLTPHREQLLRLYLDEDMSLAEIAESAGVSRQSVHDSIRSAQTQLNQYETKLGLLKRYRQLQEALQTCQECLDRVEAAPGSEQALSQARAALCAIENIEQ